jgi:hypothetical protein
MWLLNQRDGHLARGIPPVSNATSLRGPKSVSSDAVSPPCSCREQDSAEAPAPLLQRSGCQKR